MQRLMAGDKTRMQPFSCKSDLLRNLDRSMHFEKTLTAMTVTCYDRGKDKNCGLTLPSWFVQEHGDKFQKLVTLRTQPSAKAWPVTITVYMNTPTCVQVRFSAGWKAFVISNGLVEGDSLVFSLTAMSKFDVYIFRTPKSFHEPSSVQRKRAYCDSERTRKRARRPFEYRDEPLAGTRPKPSSKDRNGLLAMTKNLTKKPTADEGAEFVSRVYNRLSCSEGLHLLPSFWKRLSFSNVDNMRSRARLEFPANFWEVYGSRIHSEVKMQGIHENSPVRTMACYTNLPTTNTPGQPVRHYVRADWGYFVIENDLREGQVLFFTLAADSFFVVREVHAGD